jgi:sporulation protein YlmC with PRC-barrel domain
MLRSLKELKGFTVQATDGDIGTVRDFYFDDDQWGVRYLVVETGTFWQEPTRVLVSPVAFDTADWATQRFQVDLTRDKVKNCPSADSDKPVSRQFERDYFRYYGWPVYWGYDGLWGNWAYPGKLALDGPDPLAEDLAHSDPHLRSLHEVVGYHLMGSDGEIGHIKDFIVDDETWAVRYLVVDTSNWWSGKDVLVPPHWVERISWAENQVYVSLPREAIKNAPEWHPEAPVNREFEVRLYDYYGRPTYWMDETEAAKDNETRDSLSSR